MIPPLTQWPPEMYFLYCERAAIREHDGKVSQAEAAAAAFIEIWERNAALKQEQMF